MSGISLVKSSNEDNHFGMERVLLNSDRGDFYQVT